MMKNKQMVLWKRLIPVEILIGLVLMIISFLVASNIDMGKAQRELITTVDYMKEQCNDSQIRDLASEAKSLLRVTESVEQIRWRLEYGMEVQANGGINDSILGVYAKDSYLDGLMLLDEQGNVQEQYDSAGLSCEDILKQVDMGSLLDTIDFQEKSYAVRIALEDESQIDLAAVSRKDVKGILVGYFYTSAEYARIINNPIRTLVSGYVPDNDCTIAISSGNDILISNDQSLEGTKVEDLLILRKIMQRGTGKKLVHAKDESSVFGNHFGLMDKSQNYYIYAFMNERGYLLLHLRM